MTMELAQWLETACERYGIEAEVYEGYSGRGMYGSKTTGLTFSGDMGQLLLAALTAARDDGDDMPEIDMEFLHTDNMGRDTIIY